MVQQKEDQSTKEATEQIRDYIELTAENFEKEITQINDACVVYFTTLGAEEDITKEYKYYKQLARHLMGPIKMAAFRLKPDADDFQDLKKAYRVGKVEAGKPELRYYPNEITGETKLDRSYSLPLDLTSNDFSVIVEEIESSFESHIADVQPQLFNNYIVQYGKDQQKHVVYYMYRDEQKISLTFKHLSNHPVFKEDCAFLGMKDPPYEMFQGLREEMLPSIGFVPKLDENFQEGAINQANMDAA